MSKKFDLNEKELEILREAVDTAEKKVVKKL